MLLKVTLVKWSDWKTTLKLDDQLYYLQPVAMHHCLYKYGAYTRWMGYIDVDVCLPVPVVRARADIGNSSI